MAGFDPANNAALTAALVARCDAGQFTLTVAATSLAKVPLPPLDRAFGPASPATARVVTYSAVYRGTRLSESLVCDLSQVPYAEAAMLQRALDQVSATDARLATLGAPNPASSAAGLVPAPQTPPWADPLVVGNALATSIGNARKRLGF